MLSPDTEDTTGGSFNITRSMEPEENKSVSCEMYSAPPFMIVRIPLCLVALVLNILTIAAMISSPTKITSHIKFIISLCASDMLLAFGVLTNVLHLMRNPSLFCPPRSTFHICLMITTHSFVYTSLLVLLLCIMCIAVDHYVAIIKPLQYPVIMSHRTACTLIIIIWIAGAIGGFSNFIIGSFLVKDPTIQFCHSIRHDHYRDDDIVTGLTLFCLIVVLILYTRVYWEAKGVFKRSPLNSIGIVNNKKALSTTLLIIGSFVVCWLPHGLFIIIANILYQNDPSYLNHIQQNVEFYNTISESLFVLQILNTICDPIVYAVRLSEIQRGYRRMLRCSKFIFPNHAFLETLSMDRSFLRNSRRKTRLVLLENEAHTSSDKFEDNPEVVTINIDEFVELEQRSDFKKAMGNTSDDSTMGKYMPAFSYSSSECINNSDKKVTKSDSELQCSIFQEGYQAKQ